MRSVRRRTVSPSTSTVVPISTSRRSMVRMSRTRGTRWSVTGSAVSSAAASAGSAEFFEPLVGISPLSATPPVMTNLSMISFSLAEGLPDASAGAARRRSASSRDTAGGAHHDRGAHALPLSASSRAARSGDTPAACAMMRRARSTSFWFLGCTLTIRLP